jgi:hypothetical protein
MVARLSAEFCSVFESSNRMWPGSALPVLSIPMYDDAAEHQTRGLNTRLRP